MKRKGIVIGELLVTLVFVVLVIGVGIFIVYKFMKGGTEGIDSFQNCSGFIGTFAGAEGKCAPSCPPDNAPPREGYRWQSFGKTFCGDAGVCCLLIPSDSTASAEETKKAADLAMCQNIPSGTMVIKIDGSCNDLNAYRIVTELDKQLEIIYYMSADDMAKKTACMQTYTVTQSRPGSAPNVLSPSAPKNCAVGPDGAVTIFSGTVANTIQGNKEAVLREIAASGRPISMEASILLGSGEQTTTVVRRLQAGQPSNGGTSSDAVCRAVSPQGEFKLRVSQGGWFQSEEATQKIMVAGKAACDGRKPTCFVEYGTMNEYYFICEKSSSSQDACSVRFVTSDSDRDRLATRQC